MKQIIYIFCCLAVTLGLTAQTVTKNYILTRTYTKDDGATSLDQIQYLDGLGRPVQTVQKAITPNSADLANYTEYDGVGRAFRQWLPILNSGGSFVDLSSFSATRALYEYDTYPYTETHYEASPLNRVDWQQGPGSAWQNHPVGTSYGTNVSSDVKYFTVSGTSLQNSGYYGAATLYKTTTTDEDGKPTIEYKDKLGQVIMKRAITNEAGNHDTYYVYNDLGQLCYVLPPLAADASGSADAVNKYGYAYEYDARGNCTKKKLPGCEPITMTYYADDLLETSKDGEQRLKNQYIYYEYDALRRLTKTSLVSSSGTVVLTENYYDNYNFIGTLTALNFVTENGYDGQHPSAKGLMTGMRVRILDDTNRYLLTANYYDHKGQLVQSRSTNHLDGHDFVYNAYDFTGHVTKNLKAHSSQNTAGQTTVNELYDYRYDHAGRLDTTIYTLNDKAPVVLAANTYDELGRLIVKLRHKGADREEFDYNIRNWITRIKSGEFEEKLYYNTFPSIFNDVANKQFNGNISASTWTYGNSLNGYQYNYDKLNRYTGGYALVGGTVDIDYKFSEWYNFDKHGNINYLTRWDNYDTTDELALTYNGNQLKNVKDNGVFHNQYNTKEYQDIVKNDYETYIEEMAYDANGNLIKDLDRDIVTIQYNILNLPEIIQFKNGNQIKNTYDASGQKLSTRYKTLLYQLAQPLNEGELLSNDIDVNNNEDVTVEGYDYVGNVEYNYIRSFDFDITGEAYDSYYCNRLYNSEGYTEWFLRIQSGPKYYYFRRDHIGNNREVWLASYTLNWIAKPALTVQRTQYYPSGLPWASNTGDNPGTQNKKYNGKEFVEMHGLDEYDSEARWYYPAIMRTTTIDPLAEKYYSVSPYAWCGNNPVNRFDPDGMDWYSYQEEYTDENGKKQTRTAYKYVRGEMSEKEIEKGGYTHLGKTYDNGKGIYFSFGGAEIKYDKDNALNLMGINKIKDVDNSIIATIEGAKAVGDFWNKYGEVINNVTNATEIFGEYMDISKGFRGIVSKFGILTTTAQVGVDAYALINGELKGVRLMDAVVNLASLAGTPGAAISLTYSGTKKAANEMVKLEYSLRTFIPQLIKNANNGYWPY